MKVTAQRSLSSSFVVIFLFSAQPNLSEYIYTYTYSHFYHQKTLPMMAVLMILPNERYLWFLLLLLLLRKNDARAWHNINDNHNHNRSHHFHWLVMRPLPLPTTCLTTVLPKNKWVVRQSCRVLPRSVTVAIRPVPAQHGRKNVRIDPF